MDQRQPITRAVLLTAASFLALAAGLPSRAQDAPAPKGAAGEPAKDKATAVQEIVVTGFKASLETALQTKRVSILPIESVAAEDLGKMPDQNVAESLQRLPGIQIDRSQGQGTAVLIDGLRQNLVTLNGDIFLTGKEFAMCPAKPPTAWRRLQLSIWLARGHSEQSKSAAHRHVYKNPQS